MEDKLVCYVCGEKAVELYGKFKDVIDEEYDVTREEYFYRCKSCFADYDIRVGEECDYC